MADQNLFDEIRRLRAALEQQRQIAAAEKRRADALEASRAIVTRVSLVGRPPPAVDAPIARALPPAADDFTVGVIIPGRRRSK